MTCEVVHFIAETDFFREFRDNKSSQHTRRYQINLNLIKLGIHFDNGAGDADVDNFCLRQW